jgi:Bacterial PH domain
MPSKKTSSRQPASDSRSKDSRSSDAPLFTSSWSLALKATSAITLALLAVIFIVLRGTPTVPPEFPPLLLALPLIATLFMVRGYRVDRDGLRIVRPFWSNRFELQAITEVIPIEGDLGMVWRLAGNGGLFSITGWYSNKKVGRFRNFANHFENAVLVKLGKRNVLLAPDDVKTFIETLNHARRNLV